MKRFVSILLATLLLLGISLVSASAYTLPDNFSISAEEGTPFDSVEGEAIGYIGDADNSLNVTVKDATAIQKHLAQLITFEGVSLVLADVDLSSDITIKDATIIQKWLANLEIPQPVFHLLYTDEEAPALSLVGTWETESDLAQSINEMLPLYTDDELLLEHVNITTFPAKLIYTFTDDGKLIAQPEKNSIEAGILLVKKELEGDLANYIEAVAKQSGLNMSAQQLIKFMGYNSMSELVDEMFPMDVVNDMSKPTNATYRIDGSKLYITQEGYEEDYYENFTLTEDTLTFTSNSNGANENLYPVVFDRVN